MINLNTFKTKIVQKGDILLKQGEVAKYGFYVISGCLKSYALDHAGKEHIMQFAPENWLISDLDSFTNQVPSLVYIEAIEESEIKIISNEDFDDITALSKEAVIEIANKYRNNLIASNKRIIGLLSATAEQRYFDFTETYPTLVQRLPLKLIASYIGVTPEYLSDIRRKIAKNKH